MWPGPSCWARIAEIHGRHMLCPATQNASEIQASHRGDCRLRSTPCRRRLDSHSLPSQLPMPQPRACGALHARVL